MTTTIPQRPTAPPKPTPTPAPPKPQAAVVKLGKSTAANPPRIIISAVEGWSKTTCAAFSPSPAILMARGETGYETLRSRGLVPDVDCARIDSWPSLLSFLDSVSSGTPPFKTLALDALGGFERLCHETVVKRDFAGKWGEDGFMSFQKGPGIAVRDWLELLPRLDVLNSKGVMILVLSHTKVAKFNNPLGPDYDRYIADCFKETWAVTAKWADAVLFGTFESNLTEEKRTKKTKASDTTSDRVLHCSRTDAWDAKNRYGLPPSIAIPNDHTKTWETLAAAMGLDPVTGAKNQ